MLKNPATASQVEGLLGKAHVPTLASGQVQGFMKFYFFARQVRTSIVLSSLLQRCLMHSFLLGFGGVLRRRLPRAMACF